MPKWVADAKIKKKEEEEKKTGANTKPQSSSVKNVNKKASNSTFMGGGAPVKNVKSDTKKGPSEAKKREAAANASKRAAKSTFMGGGAPVKKAEQKQKPVKKPAKTKTSFSKSTPQKMTDTGTGSSMLEQRRANRDYNNNLKQSRIPKRTTDTSVVTRNTAEWNTVKNRSKADQQEWFTQKAKEAQKRHAAESGRKVDTGTDNLLTSAVKAAYHSGKGAVHSLSGALERSSMNDFYEGARFKYDAMMRKGMSEEAAEKYGTEKAQKRQQERLAGFRQKTKIEQEKAEAIKSAEAAKDTGLIPFRKWTVGAASVTGQRLVDTTLAGPYSLLSMGARVLEDERNSGKEQADQLKKRLMDSGQFSKEELDEEFKKIDQRTIANAYASTGLEMISEIFFRGVGLSKNYLPESASGIFDRVASKLAGRFGRTALGRSGMGIGEETLEEWIANPAQAATFNVLVGNRMQSLQEEGVRRAYQGQAQDLKELRATSADINSQAFLDRAKEIYKETGASDKEATQIAELARDYFNAEIIGDTKTAQEKLNQITDILTGGENDLRQKWTLKDAIDVAGEMIISVGAEATPGAVSTMMLGNQYKSNYGIDGVKKLAKVVENLDVERSDAAKAIEDDIDNGKDISGTQVAMLMDWANDAARKAQDREMTRDQVVQRKMRDENLFVPIVDNEYNLAPATEERFESIVERVADMAQDDMKLNMNDVDAYAIGDVVAAFETGTISAEQMNELNIENPENRAVFELATGIDLNQYIVRDANGNIREAASNTAMQQALFAKAADNYMESARIEQENWNDVERGRAFDELTSNMDGLGGVGVQRVLEAVDPRNRSDFMLAGSVARRVYEHARFTNDSWDEAKNKFVNAFNTRMDANFKYVFDMAKEAKAIAETANYGKQVTAGENMKNSLGEDRQVIVPGTVVDLRSDQSDKRLSDKSFFLKAATTFGVNIELVDNLPMVDAEGNVVIDEKTGKPVQVEGVQIAGSRTIRVNTHQDIHRSAREIVEHELFHQIRSNAPDAVKRLANYLMDRMYKANPEAFTQNIKSKQAQYAKVDPDISIEGAFEEMLANGFVEIDWNRLIEDVNADAAITSEEKASFFDSIKNAFKEILRKLRSMLASGDVTDPEAQKALQDEILLADETYSLLLKAATAAKATQAQQAIAEWQDKANKQNSPRLSLHTLDDGSQYVKLDGNLFLKDDGTEMTPREAFNTLVGKQITLNDGDVVTFIKKLPNRFDGYNELFRRIPKNKGFDDLQEVKALNEAINKNIEEVLQASDNISPNESDAGNRHAKYNIQSFDTREVNVADDNAAYRVELSIATMTDGTKFAYAKKFIEPDNGLLQKIKKAETTSNNSRLDQSSVDNISSSSEKSKFSISEPVERVKDLIAVHNLKPDDIRNTFELGGFPMPSIAVTKDSMGHDMYGDISLLFGSDTIDPKFFRSNQVFGGDAYTPTFPATQYTPNEDIVEKFRDIYYDNAKTLGYDAMRPFYELAEDAENALNRNGGEQGLIDRYKNDVRAMRTFLKINGKDVEDVVKRTEDTISETEQKLRQHFIDTLGEDAIREFEGESIPHGKAMMDHRKNWTYEHSGEIKSAYRDFLNREFSFSDEEISNVLDNMNLFETMKLVRNALNYLNNGPTTVKEEVDRAATDKAIEDAAHELGYEEWIDGLLTGIEEKRGIRNDKEFFTRNGNRRSWDTLHDDITLENVVKAMRSELAAGGNGFLWKNPKGAAQKQYKSLDEIRADEDRLQQLPEEEYKSLEQAATQKLSDVLSDVVDNNPGRFMNSFGAVLDTGEYIAEILNETRDKDTMQRKLKKDYSLEVSDEQMDRIAEAIEEIANIPTGYFEAKPRRAVGFDEVQAAIIPNNLDEDIKTGLSDRGITTYEYDPEVEGDRTQKINDAASENDLRFSISANLDEPYMDAVNSGNMDEAQKLVDEAAYTRNYVAAAYHGTPNGGFTVFGGSQTRNGAKAAGTIWFAEEEEHANVYRSYPGGWPKAENPQTYHVYLDTGIWADIGNGRVEALDYSRNGEGDASKDLKRVAKAIVSYTAWQHRDESERTRTKKITNTLTNIARDIYADFVWQVTETQEFADLCKEQGLDSVVAWEEHHDGDGKSHMVKTWGVFEPTQVKTSDPVTYAEDGSVIPLSERFDPENNDIRYSLPTQDADGKILTDGQMEYFKNSQARDIFGRLVPVYHGTFRGPRITIFDGSGDGYWFTSSRDVAEDYTTGYEMGVPGAQVGTERNPYDSDDEYFAKKGIRIEQDSDGDWRAIINRNGREHYWGSAESKEELIDNLYTANENEDLFDSQFTLRDYYPVYLNLENPRVIDCNGSMHDDVNGTGMTTRELAAEAKLDGYDGIIFRNVVDPFEAHDVYVAFSSNQVKDINNENPTENPDIRYSITDEDEAKSQIAYDDAMDNSYELLAYYEQQLNVVNPETFDVTKAFREEDVVKFLDALKAEDSVPSDDPKFEEDRVRMAKSKEEFFNSVNARWNDRWITEGEVLKISSVKRAITNLVKGAMSNSNSDAQYRNEIVKKTLVDARLAYQLMKQDRTELASYLLYHAAQRMMDGLEFIRDDTAFKEYKGIRDFLRQYRINAPEEYWENEKFLDFRKEYYGRLRIGKGISNIEDVYQDCQDRWPHLFNVAEREKADNLGDSPEDLLLHIGVVIDSNVTPFYEAYSSEEAASLATDLADQLYEIIANGDREVSLADSYKERFDAKTKAMKQRHYEAILRERKIREEGIQKERIKFREYKETQKEKALHSKHFDSIKKKYDELTRRLLTNTKDKHIPEQYKKELAGLLKAFDFQTVGSKKREARTGYKAQNTIKLEAMRTALERIEANSQFFHINDSITDIIKDLLGLNEADMNKQSIEGKTLDELNAAELKQIDKLLGFLIHEFNNYEKVKVGVKKAQAADIGHAQNDISLEHADSIGEGKDYQTPFLQSIDRIVNLDMMTPAFLFRKIDPNNEGLGLMWKEIRRSFDKYVRNTNQLNEWIEDIVGEYHDKGILWNKYGSGELSKWRSTNYAQKFDLTYGTLELTPAQMMSVACLANRKQAYDHMIGAGVVVTPVSFQAKIMSDVKKKINKSLSQKLTDADIKTIVAALTPEQRQVANKLQELMATKMADWGNEASINVLGIKLFEDPDYFPIRSDKKGLAKDLDPNQFEQAIRNFGFTKAVQPGARNAIMIDDIFDVVTEHCNNMNLYNSYTEAMNDFMKVYNYREVREDGEYTVEQALSHAFSEKAPMFIMQFIRDLNGNVSGRPSGIESLYNALLANAKKASVFANFRVAAQQPTAISRAFYVIDEKYIKGIKVDKDAMVEMFEHCPIALWKSWGYYDINMGKSIEDVIMNNGRWLEDKATDLYGALDNVTWTAIWQMVKAETKDLHPELKEGSDEFFEHCNERMSDIVDLTQVVDSPMHRSHAMRDKGFFKKMTTAFMAEPTLTFNMLRDGVTRTSEAYKRGKKKLASQILSRTIGVYLLQSVMVAGAQSLVDALRGKKPDKDDDDDRFLHLWWVNFVEDWKDEFNPLGKIYVVKDIKSMMDGWESRNLALQGVYYLSLGYRQLTGNPYARSSKSWYENMLYGLGYLTGVPAKTMMTGTSNAKRMLGVETPILDDYLEFLDSFAKAKEDDDSDGNIFSNSIGELLRQSMDAAADMMGYKPIESNAKTVESKSEVKEKSKKEEKADKANFDKELKDYEESLSDKYTDDQKKKLVKQYQKKLESETTAEYDPDMDVNAHIQEGLTNFEYEMEKRSLKAAENAAGKTGNARNDALWDVIAEGYTKSVESGNMGTIQAMRDAFVANGGDADWFDAKITDKMKSAYKKTVGNDPSEAPGSSARQELMHEYLTNHGVSDEEISEIVRKTYTARDLKAALRIGNEEYIMDELVPLISAGLTRADFEYLYKYRNYGAKDYDGKYTDPKYTKTTGTFIWPTDGVITSHFGYRNAPTAGASSNHPAIDIGAPKGTPVLAADGGVVIYAGSNGGYGNSVGVKHANGMVTYYNHLSAWNVKVGDQVGQGQQIAQVGSTGISTGPHLDFKILDENGTPVDPEKYLNKR